MELAQNCMSDQIKNTIMKRIHEGFYMPGEKLIETRLAQEFNTAISPVHEALCQLGSMRLIENDPLQGTHIRSITDQDLKECLQVRGVLESLAAKLVEDRLVKQIDELAAVAKETLEAAYDDDASKYALANLHFHSLIVEGSNNQILINMWRMLAPQVRMLAITKLSLGLLKQSAQEHLEIVAAFADGDNCYAGELLKKHAEAVLMRGFTKLYTRTDQSS